jgi:hypothetical protein
VGFTVWGVECGVWGFEVHGLGGVAGVWFGALADTFLVQGLGFRVHGLGFRI